MTRRLHIIDAPTSAGAYAPGQQDGPHALHAAGLDALLLKDGVELVLAGACDRFRWGPDPDSPRAANAAAVVHRAGQIADLVAAVPPAERVLVLGGDCTTGVGTVAGLIRRGDDAGLVYLDRHADLNVPGSVIDGALDWMGVAHMLGVDGALPELARLAGRLPMLASERIVLLGLGPHTAFEAEQIAARGLSVTNVEALIADPPGAAAGALAALDGAATVAVHFDVDLVNFLDAPLAENVDRGPAPTLDATGEALRVLLADDRVRALTVTEFNPHHGAEDGSTTRRLAAILVAALTP